MAVLPAQAIDRTPLRRAEHFAFLRARQTRVLALVVGAAFLVSVQAGTSAFEGSARSAPSGEATAASLSDASPMYPLKASANNRYLVDQLDVPFLMIGDSPQALIGNLSETEAATFIANRQAYGINPLWINLLCNDSTGCKSDGTTLTGLPPSPSQAISQHQTSPIFGARTR